MPAPGFRLEDCPLAKEEEMKKRPEKCCPLGTYECQIPMPCSGRVRHIDICIADIVAALNAANIRTVASCCGHGEQDAIISLDDGREITIKGVGKEAVG
jgi:hypothetical protein